MEVFGTHVEGEAYGGADEIQVLLLHRRRQEIVQAIHELRLVIHRDHAVAFIHRKGQKGERRRDETFDKAGPILAAPTFRSHNWQSEYLKLYPSHQAWKARLDHQ